MSMREVRDEEVTRPIEEDVRVLFVEDDRTRGVPVVILSNYSQQELVERGLRMGALEYLVKSQTTPARVAGAMSGWIS